MIKNFISIIADWMKSLKKILLLLDKKLMRFPVLFNFLLICKTAIDLMNKKVKW